jgi:hypothetical protein
MPDYDYQADARPFSRVIADIGAREEPRLYLGELVNAFGERGFGALMLFLGLLNTLPLPPGSTTVLGAPLLLICAQLMFRFDQLWLPGWVLRGSIDRAGYRKGSQRIVGPLRAIERLSRPRLLVMTGPASEALIGLVCTILCVILVLPIPLGNMAPALTIAVFGFGLTQRDGAVILLGWVGAVACGSILFLAWRIIAAAFDHAAGWIQHLI